VTEWWGTDLEGLTTDLGDKFTIRFNDTFVDFTISEVVDNKRISWHVTGSNLPWLKDATEWNGTTVRFDLLEEGEGTRITLTHEGLTEAAECFEKCMMGWEFYFCESLRKLILEGQGMPNSRACKQENHE
jgi:hypothetical protein